MENTIQYINGIEKSKFMIDFNAKKDIDIILYWHYETIKEELIYNYLKDR